MTDENVKFRFVSIAQQLDEETNIIGAVSSTVDAMVVGLIYYN